MKKLTIETKLDDDGGYISVIKELDCIGDGKTELESIKDVMEVALDLLELADKDHIIILGK